MASRLVFSGSKLRDERLARGLTQIALSYRTVQLQAANAGSEPHTSCVDPARIRHYEVGSRKPSDLMVSRLAEALGCKPEDLCDLVEWT